MIKKKQYFSIVVQKGVADLVAEARRGYMGILWWVVEPVLYMAAFYLVFVVIFDRGGEDRVTFLLIGIVVWRWFDRSIRSCSESIASNVSLIRQVYMPKVIFPGMVLMTSTLKFLIVFSLLMVYLLIIGKEPGLAWISLPIFMMVQLIFMFALGSFLAAIVPFVPDLRVIIDNVMTLMFFMSGVFFDLSMATGKVAEILNLNPMVGVIQTYRNILVDGAWPDWSVIGLVMLYSVVFLAAGLMLLSKYDKVYAKVI